MTNMLHGQPRSLGRPTEHVSPLQVTIRLFRSGKLFDLSKVDLAVMTFRTFCAHRHKQQETFNIC